MKIFEKILEGSSIIVYILTLLILVVAKGEIGIFTFLDALPFTIAWATMCTLIWIIVKIFIHFTKKTEKK